MRDFGGEGRKAKVRFVARTLLRVPSALEQAFEGFAMGNAVIVDSIEREMALSVGS
jgi:hypothetical protein